MSDVTGVAGDALATYTASAWLSIVACGGVFGALGQALRIVPGMHKLNRRNAERPEQPFDWQVLGMSLVFGAVAGMLAALVGHDVLLGADGAPRMGLSAVLGLMAAGYAGADFIEAFAGRRSTRRAPAPAAKRSARGLAALPGSIDEYLG
jgi:hypothetical protein